MSSKEFGILIEKMVSESPNVTHMDAVIEYCRKNEIDPSQVKPLIGKNLKQKIELDAQELNYLPKTGRLPI